MPLSSDPSVTYNSQGNILATSTSIAASAAHTGSIVDFSSSSLGGWVQVTPTGGSTVATTNGCQVSIYPAGDSAPHYDYYPLFQQTIAIVASTATPLSFLLQTGKYSITLTNVDATNAITAGITSNPVA
jgi:hypothetical protein